MISTQAAVLQEPTVNTQSHWEGLLVSTLFSPHPKTKREHKIS